MGSASEDRKRPLEENNWERNCWKPWGEQAGATPFLSSLSLSAAKVLFLESCVPCCLINVFNCCRSALKTLSWSKTVILKQVELHFFSTSWFQAVLGKAVSHQVWILYWLWWDELRRLRQIFSVPLLHQVRCSFLPCVYSMLALGVLLQACEWAISASKEITQSYGEKPSEHGDNRGSWWASSELLIDNWIVF